MSSEPGPDTAMVKKKRVKLDTENPVAALREALELNHVDIGNAAGVQKQTAYGYGVEGNKIRVSTLAKIAEGVGYDLELVLVRRDP